MVSNDSDEIVLISKHEETMDRKNIGNDSDIECEVVDTGNTSKFPKRKAAITKQSKPKKVRKKEISKKEVTNKTSEVNEKVESPQPKDVNKTTEKVVPVMIKPENVNKNKIICKDGENEKTYYLDYHESLEALYTDLSQDAKIKYKGLYVSKFLTLDDLNFTEDDNVFEIIGNKRKMLNIKINLDFNKTTCLNVPEDTKVYEIFKLFDSLPDKENKLVINGYILDETKLLCEIVEDEDVLDYV